MFSFVRLENVLKWRSKFRLFLQVFLSIFICLYLIIDELNLLGRAVCFSQSNVGELQLRTLAILKGG